MEPNTAAGSDAGSEKRTHHLCVCICTFKRPELLNRLLISLSNQKTEGAFSFSIVVSDNDAMQSARPVVASFSSESQIPITYCFEPQQNIAMARNNALAHADGDFVLFIDDDEFAIDSWLHSLLSTCLKHNVDGVLGPVKAFFEAEVPKWLIKGRFFDRQFHATGSIVKWPEARTGNVLFRKRIVDGMDRPFRPEFATAGEDVDFFRQMIENGHKFIWCDEAVVYESVPASRCTRGYVLKRALLRGSNFPKHPRHRMRNLAKSLIAVPCYTLALPLLALLGDHVFMSYLIKLVDHSSRLLAFAGLPLARQRNI
jgi:glycosyltransferase involved in cell wall biosynthesis